LANVVAKLLDHVGLVARGLHVDAAQPLHVLLIERARHRHDRAELVLDGGQVTFIEHLGVARKAQRVPGKDVPRAEHEVVQRRERNEVFDTGHPPLGALSEADRAKLRHRANRWRQTAPGEQDAGDERGRDRAEAGQQDAEFSASRSDGSVESQGDSRGCNVRARNGRAATHAPTWREVSSSFA
jgi:hypothetical protein